MGWMASNLVWWLIGANVGALVAYAVQVRRKNREEAARWGDIDDLEARWAYQQWQIDQYRRMYHDVQEDD